MLSVSHSVWFIVKLLRNLHLFIPNVVACNQFTSASLFLHVNESVVKRWLDILISVFIAELLLTSTNIKGVHFLLGRPESGSVFVTYFIMPLGHLPAMVFNILVQRLLFTIR